MVGGGKGRVFSDGTYTYTFDQSGNTLSKKSATTEVDYVWDQRKRLVSVLTFAVTNGVKGQQLQQVDYSYDVFNRLKTRKLTIFSSGQTSSGTTYRFVYDGKNMVLALNGAGRLTDRYLWGPAVDQILADEQLPGTSGTPTAAGVNYWMMTDNLGSVRDIVGSYGQAEHIEYGDFGKVVYVTGTSLTTAIGYTGGFYDSAVGIVYHSDPAKPFPGRWEDINGIRWLNPDQSGLGPDSNPYRYCTNSPINSVDPSGLANKTINTGVRGVKLFLEWWPEKFTGELKVISRAGHELSIVKYIVNKETGEAAWHCVKTRAGKELPGISESLFKKLAPKVKSALETVMRRTGGQLTAVHLAKAAGEVVEEGVTTATTEAVTEEVAQSAAAGAAAEATESRLLGRVMRLMGVASGPIIIILTDTNSVDASEDSRMWSMYHESTEVNPADVGITNEELSAASTAIDYPDREEAINKYVQNYVDAINAHYSAAGKPPLSQNEQTAAAAAARAAADASFPK